MSCRKKKTEKQLQTDQEVVTVKTKRKTRRRKKRKITHDEENKDNGVLPTTTGPVQTQECKNE